MKPLLQLVPLLFIIIPVPPASSATQTPADIIELPFNEYNALKLLAKWKVSTIELPLYIDNELDDIHGADNNQNMVRDDYEKVLLSSYQRPEYVVMGLLAAQEWGHLLDVYTNNLEFKDISQAKAFLDENADIKMCYAKLQKIDNMLLSPIDAYFNTGTRQSAKLAAEEKLLSVIGRQHKTASANTKPCSVFTRLINNALAPNLNTADNYDLQPEHIMP